MLLRRPSSLPISARVVAVKPLRAKHFAAADKIDATRGFSQSAERCWGFSPFSSAGLRTIGVLTTVSVVVVMLFNVPASRYWAFSSRAAGRRPLRGRLLRPHRAARQAYVPPDRSLAFFFLVFAVSRSLGPGASGPSSALALLSQKGIPAASVQPLSPNRPASRDSRITLWRSPAPSSASSAPCVTTSSSSARYSGWRSSSALTWPLGRSAVPTRTIWVVGGYTSSQRSRAA